MLVLTRKVLQKIQIGDTVTVTILQVKGQGVKIGIQAPKDVRVLRSELVSDLSSGVSVERSASASESTELALDETLLGERPFPVADAALEHISTPRGSARCSEPTIGLHSRLARRAPSAPLNPSVDRRADRNVSASRRLAAIRAHAG